jgi:GNAT superfamily N-acetyltransferase
MAVHLMALNEELITPSNLTIELVGDVKTLEQWIQALTIGYGIPASVGNLLLDSLASLGSELPWRHYTGWLAGRPVACSSLLLGAGVAGVYAVGTVPEARGQGIGAALTLAALREARAMGYRIGILGSSQMGLGLYRRLGFQEYCKFGICIWEGKVAQSE